MSQSNGHVDADYLAAAGRLLAPVKTRSYELLQLLPGMRVADIGCGPGIDTAALASQVGQSGRVEGIDFDAHMVALAQQRAEAAGIDGWTAHRCADACALPLADASQDATRSERLFMHLSDPSSALAEMVRVTRPGGRVVVVDSDWGTLSVDSALTETERTLARVRTEQYLQNGYSGRTLYRLFKQAGLAEVEVEAITACLTDYPLARYLMGADQVEQKALEQHVLDHRQLEEWRVTLQQAHENGDFFGTLTLVLARGVKP